MVQNNELINSNLKKFKIISETTSSELVGFFESDYVYRMCAGKKERVMKKNVKKQRGCLLIHLKIFIIFLHKNPNCRISYPTFCRLCPFWVTNPKLKDRDTCTFIIHANIDLHVY